MAEAHKPPQDFTLRLRRYDPESGEAPYWDEHTIELEPHRSVLEGILQAKARFDGSIGIRCSCRAAICGSCGVRINGQPGLACHTHLDKALASARDGVIEVEPMGNMPVIKDLIVDMDAVHWKKIQRVTPWLINKEPIPEREYVVPRESMVDVTQSMACIQCGACVSDCLSMEVDPLFIGPAALAKAYRFVGDPRDAQQFERLKDLAEDPHGIYDCTHCFKCIEACPKGVAPMSQIMRLRRRAGDDHDINDRNNGERHEQAFVTLVRDNGLLWEAELLPRSYGGNSFFGKFAPPVGARARSTRCRSSPRRCCAARSRRRARSSRTRSPRTTSSRSSGSTTPSRAATSASSSTSTSPATTRTTTRPSAVRGGADPGEPRPRSRR